MAESRNTTPGMAQAVCDLLRRKLMGRAVGPTAENPDAELIGLCARCDVLQQQVDALHVRPSDDMTIDQEIAWEQARDVRIKPVSDQQEELFERICELRVTTMQGHVARARTLVGWDKEVCRPGDYHSWSEQLVGAVVRDLVASA